jgi:anti-sigma regulatory factor (Ser/Thr protein kinase)
LEQQLDFESTPEVVAVARRFVRDVLRAWQVETDLDAVLLVTSELVTNAVLHARTEGSIRVILQGDHPPVVRIEVYDQNPRRPSTGPCPTDATSGRGLALVNSLARAWGMDNYRDGKVVWAEVGSVSEPAPAHSR